MVVAYVIVSRKALLQCTRKEDFEVRISSLFDGLESFRFEKLHFVGKNAKSFPVKKIKNQTHYLDPVHTAPKEFENATIMSHFEFVFQQALDREIS